MRSTSGVFTGGMGSTFRVGWAAAGDNDTGCLPLSSRLECNGQRLELPIPVNHEEGESQCCFARPFSAFAIFAPARGHNFVCQTACEVTGRGEITW